MMGSSKERDLSSIFYIIRLKDVDVSRNMEKMGKPKDDSMANPFIDQSYCSKRLPPANRIAQNLFRQPIRTLKTPFASQSECV